MFSMRRLRSRVSTKAIQYLRCGAKTATFLFWASIYMVVMNMTLFKSNVNTPVKDWSMLPDNYSNWLGPVISDEDVEEDDRNIEWSEPDNLTISELANRAQTIRDVCRKRNILSQKINNKEFFVDHTHNIVYCNIFKAASSSWLYYFNVLGGYSQKYLAGSSKPPIDLARQKFPRPSIEELNDAVNTPGVVSLLVVREPFVRLLSGYRDKLENLHRKFYRKLVSAIISKYRKRAVTVFGPIKSHGPTFYEFVAYLIDQFENNSSVDEHFAPYYEFCSPCAVNFNVIAKVETLDRDSMYVIQYLKLGNILDRKVRKRKMRLRNVVNKSWDGKNTTALLKKYFSQLDEDMLNRLLNIYGVDFEMFGYDPTIYKSYVRKEKIKNL